MSGLFDYELPTIHPRLREPVALRKLATQWVVPGALRIAEVLAPGIAAEIAPFAGRLPHVVSAQPDPASIMWGCELGIPEQPDPQYPACMYRLSRFLDRDLPGLVTALTGREYVFASPGRVRTLVFRKGCYADAPAEAPPVDHVVVALGLTGETWPAEWGGHVELLDDDGSVASVLSPSMGALDLICARRFRIPLITRDVEVVLVTGHLEPR